MGSIDWDSREYPGHYQPVQLDPLLKGVVEKASQTHPLGQEVLWLAMNSPMISVLLYRCVKVTKVFSLGGMHQARLHLLRNWS